MENTLQRLLDTELRAQGLVQEANEKGEQMIQQAREEARHAEERFEARVPEIHESFVSRAEQRAVQAVGEMARRYEETRRELMGLAEQRLDEAIDNALTTLLDAGR